MKAGTLVKFAKPIAPGEAEAVMIVLEDRDTRVLVVDHRHAGWPVPPTAVYAKSDLMEIKQ